VNDREMRDDVVVRGRAGPVSARPGQDPPVIAAVVLVGLVLTAGLSGRFRMAGVVALAAMSLLWLVVNGPMEGPILAIVAPGHGLTGGDLAGLAGLALAAYRFTALRRARVAR
jgi:hypothetical protein